MSGKKDFSVFGGFYLKGYEVDGKVFITYIGPSVPKVIGDFSVGVKKSVFEDSKGFIEFSVTKKGGMND